MSHRLSPRFDQSWLTPDEVVERLREEFRFVQADREAGADHVGDMIAALLRMKAGRQRGRDASHESSEIDRVIARLELVRDDAMAMSVSDDPASEFEQLEFAIVPGEPILIGYSCRQHEDAGTLLAKRVAAALNYDVKLV